MTKNFQADWTQTRNFIAWDGEGIGKDDNHRYIMVCNSEGDYLINENGISLYQFVTWLDSIWKESWNTATHVGFAIGYDVNMLLGDAGGDWVLDREELESLWTTGEVDISNVGPKTDRKPGITVSYRHRKEFTIARYSERRVLSRWHNKEVITKRWVVDKKGKYHAAYDWVFHLWDVQGFFQCSFVSAINQYLPEQDRREIHFIESEKARRGKDDWDILHVDTMLQYCLLECRLLVKLMNELARCLDYASIHVSRWDGAGSVAATLMKRYGIKKHINQDLVKNIRKSIAQAYAGGRIEAIKYGHYEGKVYCYDIRSAYPSVIQHLPSQRRGKFLRVEPKRKISPFGLYHIRWECNFSAPFYPFYWRDKNGRIYYPQFGQGWYYGQEVMAIWKYPESIVILK